MAEGAALLCGNDVHGSLYAPTVLEDVPATCSIWQEEAFAPVVVLQPFESFEDAIEQANAIDYSLHAGIFTSRLDRALTRPDCWRQVE